MKRIISILLCITMVITLASASLTYLCFDNAMAGDNTPQITFESKTITSGATFTVDVSIVNNPGFAYLELSPTYDSSLELISIENGNIIEDFTYFSGATNCFWLSEENVTTNGTLATLTFKMSSEADEGDYNFGFTLRKCATEDEINVPIVINSGAVTVSNTSIGGDTPISTPTIKAETVNAKAGNTASVKINIINNPGFMYARLKVTYDSRLTCSSATFAEDFDEDGTASIKKKSSYVNLTWDSEDESTISGEFATLEFDISDNVETGSLPITITFEEDDIYNYNEDNVTFDIVDGTINIVENCIDKAAIIVGSNLRLRIVAIVDDAISNPKMRYTMGNEIMVVEGTMDKTGKWSFENNNICANNMCDKIKLELLDNETVVATKDYSVKTYCDTLYKMTAVELGISAEKKTKLDTFIADMLEYGAMTQLYSGYNTNILPNTSSWVVTNKTSVFTKPTSNKATLVGVSDPNNKIQNAYLALNDCIEIAFTVKIQNATTFEISNGCDTVTYDLAEIEATNGKYIFTSGKLAATQLEDVFTATLKNGTQILHQISYSVNSYVVSKYNDTNVDLANLVKAVCNYGASAKGYQQND